MVWDFNEAGVLFYEGCLIVEVHDHKSVAVEKEDEARPTSRSKQDVPNSIHKYNRFVTPSPNRPFPKDAGIVNSNAKNLDVEQKEKPAGLGEQGNSSASSSPQAQKTKTPSKPKIYTLVLFPTQLSRQADIALRACNPRHTGQDGTNGVPPTPSAVVPPTPTGSSMPPPAKRVKRERMELDSGNIHAAEGAMLLATLPPLDLEPTKDAAGTIRKLEEQAAAVAHRFQDPPKPKTRKRTVAEMAADEAHAAETERFLLALDDRNGQGSSSVPGGEGQQPAAPFDPTFERFKKLEEIKREHAEKAKQEKIKAAEKERQVQEMKAQQAQQLQQQQQAAAAAEESRRREQAAAQHAQQEEASKRMQMQQQQQQLQNMHRMQAQAKAAAVAAAQQTMASGSQNVHSHPMPNGQINGVPVSLPVSAPNGIQARLQGGMSQPAASSPMVRQSTPQNMSSPMVGGVPMQPSGSNMGAGSPARPPSVQPGMSAPMAISMSARGSQQSHPSGTPRMPHATPNMAHATPMSRAQLSNTPRMTQASPPPNMMAPQMTPGMMANAQQAMGNMPQNPNMSVHAAQMLAMQQRAQAQAQAQQQQLMMQNAMNGNSQQQAAQQAMQARFIAAQQEKVRAGQMGQMMAQNPQMLAQMQMRAMQQQQANQVQMPPGNGPNMVNGGNFANAQQQQAAMLRQMQQRQQIIAAQQQQQQQQQQQGHPQQMMGGQAGQQLNAAQQAAQQRQMQQLNVVQNHAQRIFQQSLPNYLQSRGLTQETIPPQQLQEFKAQCFQRARALVMQQAANPQNAQQQIIFQRQQAALMAQQQAMQAQAMQNMSLPQGM